MGQRRCLGFLLELLDRLGMAFTEERKTRIRNVRGGEGCLKSKHFTCKISLK